MCRLESSDRRARGNAEHGICYRDECQNSKNRSCDLLVGIASYGEKNLHYLRKIIGIYQDLPYDVDIVVFSEAPKELDSRVKVVVGLPSRNSWSLPFAHKRYFAENARAL